MPWRPIRSTGAASESLPLPTPRRTARFAPQVNRLSRDDDRPRCADVRAALSTMKRVTLVTSSGWRTKTAAFSVFLSGRTSAGRLAFDSESAAVPGCVCSGANRDVQEP
jgi:hypothetical protein